MDQLLVDVARHDLPPRWDGHDVTWTGWREGTWSTAELHLPLKDQCCRRCGSLGRAIHNRGLVHDDEAGHQVLEYFAFRCPDCHHDQVLVLTTGDLWDLDLSDYTDTGSTYDAAAHRAGLVQAARDAVKPTRPRGEGLF